MLMTPNKVQAANITGKGQELLTAIRAAGKAGITRKGLSDAIGKALNKWDLAQLDLLEAEGAITVAQRPVGNRTISEYVYRVK
jgi:hypothetical protein